MFTIEIFKRLLNLVCVYVYYEMISYLPCVGTCLPWSHEVFRFGRGHVSHGLGSYLPCHQEDMFTIDC